MTRCATVQHTVKKPEFVAEHVIASHLLFFTRRNESFLHPEPTNQRCSSFVNFVLLLANAYLYSAILHFCHLSEESRASENLRKIFPKRVFFLPSFHLSKDRIQLKNISLITAFLLI